MNYTSIEQSKKLAEILPIESADMHYNNGSCRGVDYTEHFSAELMPYQEALHLMEIHKTNFMFQVIPCWSLAAIIKLLPYDIKGHNLAIYKSYCPNEKTFAYELSYEGDFYDYELSILASTSSIELIDACYEMIIKLNELKML